MILSGTSSKGKLTNKPSRFLNFLLSSFLLFCFLFSKTPFTDATAVSDLIPELTQKLNQHYLSFQGLRAYLELELSQPGIATHRSFGQIAFQPEGEKLYFKTFSQLTPHYFTLISKGDSFWLQIPKKKMIYTGPVEAIGKENFELKITPQDFKRILVPNPVDQTPDNIRMEEKPDYWLLTLYAPAGQTGQTLKEREIWLDKISFRVFKDIRFSANGTPYIEIRWEEFEKDSSGQLFPTLITLFKPTTGYLLRLKLKKWAVAGKVPDELFEMAHPGTYQTETISR